MALNPFTAYTKLFQHKDVNLRIEKNSEKAKLHFRDLLKISHRYCWPMDHRPKPTYFLLRSIINL